MARKRGRKRGRGRNPALSLSGPVKAATSTLNVESLSLGAAIVSGNTLGLMLGDTITRTVPFFKDSNIARLAMRVVAAGLVGYGAAMVLGKKRGDEVRAGAIAAAVHLGLQTVLPGTFGTPSRLAGLFGNDELDGWDDTGLGDFVRPQNIQRAFGISDYATLPQAGGAARLLDGLGADDVVSQEIAAQA